MSESVPRRARPVGINHVAIEVGDIDEALAFYGALFEFDLRGRTETAAFLDFGDQFLALSEVDRKGKGNGDRDDDGDGDSDVDTNERARAEGDLGGAADGEQNGSATDRTDHRHFGLVVDDTDVVERRLSELDAGQTSLEGADFRDPWGNWVQVVDYGEVQFTKAAHVLRGMGLESLEKTDAAVSELEAKGMAPE